MKKDKIAPTMDRIIKLLFVIVFLVFVGCKKEDAPQKGSSLHKEIAITSDEVSKPEKQTASKEEEDFNQFFELFNQDSIFQVSRIDFPLKVKMNNDDYELVDFTIAKAEYKALNLNIKTEHRDYIQKLILKNDKSVITQRGTNNGIFIDYIFEKRNGKWQLMTWIDVST